MDTLTIHLPSTVEEASELIASAYNYEDNNKIYGDEKVIPVGENFPDNYDVVINNYDIDGNTVSSIIREYTIISKEEFAKNKTWEVLTEFYKTTADIIKQKAKQKLLDDATKSIDTKISQIVIPSGGSLEINKDKG